MEFHFFRELLKTLRGDYKDWEERNGFISSDKIKSINYLRKSQEYKKTIGEDISQKIALEEIEKIEVKEKDIFQSITGYDSLKTIFNNVLSSKEPVHILLTGAPGTAKTLFLEAVGNNVKDAYFITNNATGPGILALLYEKQNLRYLCIDEIDKIPRDQLAVLLTLMESGKLIITKKTMMVNRDQNLTIFATCNRLDRLAPEMQSRFLKFYLQPYTMAEFNMIAKNLITKRFKKSESLAEKIATAVWQEMGSQDIRDCIKVARLVNKEEEVDMIISALKEYGKKEDYELT